MFRNGILFCLVVVGFFACDRVGKDKTLVKIGSQEITRQDFEAKLKEYQINLALLPKAEKKEMKKLLIHELMEETALFLEAQKRGLSIDPAQVDAEKKRHQGQKSNADMQAKFLQMSVEDVDEKLRRHLLLEKVQQHISQSASAPSEVELKRYYFTHKREFERKKQYQLEMLESKHEKEARQAYKKVAEEGFVSLQVDTDVLDVQYRPAKWYEKDLLPKIVVTYLRDARVDGMSSMLKSPYGYHIVKLLKVRPAYIPAFEAIKDEIAVVLMEEKRKQVLLDWKKEFFSSTKIERNSALIDKL